MGDPGQPLWGKQPLRAVSPDVRAPVIGLPETAVPLRWQQNLPRDGAVFVLRIILVVIVLQKSQS